MSVAGDVGRTMSRRRKRALAVVIAAAMTGTLGACAAPGESTATSTPTRTAAPTATPTQSPTPSPTPTPEPVAATCENITAPDSLARLNEAGWTAVPQDDPWVGTDLPGSIQCLWGDHSVGNDFVTLIGWAPIDPARADAEIAELLASGEWQREDADEGVYVTSLTELFLADEDGYGYTYLFTDGQLKFASSKSELAGVVAPEGFQP